MPPGPPSPKTSEVSSSEVFKLAAASSDFYCQTFFPHTFRQESPAFHRDLWELLSDPRYRKVAVMVFRGGGKTTILRAFASFRIAYGISNTIVFVGEAQEHSRRSLRWLRRQVETNRRWAETYGLEPGKPWTDDICEIRHAILGKSCTIVAMGITGQIRGINIDDYRPDLIIIDDPCNEENTATPEQRKKTEDLVFGALEHNLAPRSECPEAKIIILQTPLHQDDIISLCHRDSSWASRRYGCFDSAGNSLWEARFPTLELLREKENAIRLGQLHLWLREMECSIVSGENAVFRADWLREYDLYPEGMVTFMGIDPVPPPTDSAIEKRLHDRDFECLAVVGRRGGEYYLLEYVASRGHTPEWTVAQFFRLLERWRPLRVRVETTAYQATLKWLLEQEMRRRGRYVVIDGDDTKRKKLHLITQALSGIAANGALYVRRDMYEFKEQFSTYPFCAHDDIINAVALAVNAGQNVPVLDGELVLDAPGGYIPLDEWRTAP